MKNVEEEEDQERYLEERTLGLITLSIWLVMHHCSLPVLGRPSVQLFIQ